MVAVLCLSGTEMSAGVPLGSFGTHFSRRSTARKAPPAITLDGDNAITPERRLWIAVILQAFADASWKGSVPQSDAKYRDVVGKGGKVRRLWLSQQRSRPKEEQAAQATAVAWLRGNTRGFVDVCQLAGADPSCVRDAAKRAAANGWPAIYAAEI